MHNQFEPQPQENQRGDGLNGQGGPHADSAQRRNGCSRPDEARLRGDSRQAVAVMGWLRTTTSALAGPGSSKTIRRVPSRPRAARRSRSASGSASRCASMASPLPLLQGARSGGSSRVEGTGSTSAGPPRRLRQRCHSGRHFFGADRVLGKAGAGSTLPFFRVTPASFHLGRIAATDQCRSPALVAAFFPCAAARRS